jgi:uridine nucleosidase
MVAMRNALMAQPSNCAWVVATGPLTNIGLLFATFPEVASHIAGLSIMGGAVGDGFTGVTNGKTLGQSEGFGNETPWAEFNIYCDPEAARAVFSSPVLAPKTTLICLDLTHQCLATKPVRESLLHGPGATDPLKQPSQLRVLLSEILEFFAASYDEFFDIKAGPPLHDPLAVAVLFGFAAPQIKNPHAVIFEDDSQRYSVSVVTAGEHSSSDAIRGQVGRTVVKPSDIVGHGVRIPRKLNVDAFWQVLEECCSMADKHNDLQQA